MSRYIDADALKNDINAQVKILNTLSVSTGIDELRQIGEELQRGLVAEIDKQPTVDAVPVVHAYWIIKPHGTYGQLRAFCSACGKHSGIGGIVSNQKKPYCPNCGAIMDGKEIVDG